MSVLVVLYFSLSLESASIISLLTLILKNLTLFFLYFLELKVLSVFTVLIIKLFIKSKIVKINQYTQKIKKIYFNANFLA